MLFNRVEGFLASLFDRAEKEIKEFNQPDSQIEKIIAEKSRERQERIKQRINQNS